MLNPQGLVSRVHRREHLRGPPRHAHHPAAVGGRARGHHPGHGHRPSPRTSASRCVFGDLTRSDLYIADEMFVCGTAAEVSAVNSVDDRADPVPRPDDHGHRRGVRQGRPGPGRPVQGLGRACAADEPPAAPAGALGRDLRHDAARRRPVRGHLAHRRRQAAGRRAARLARRAPGSRAATRRPTRRTRSSSGGPSPSCTSTTATLVAFGSTRRPPGKVDVDPTLRSAGRRRHVHGVHRRQVLGLPRHRGARHHARRGRGHGGGVGRVPEGRRPAGVLRRRALLRRLQGQPRVHPAGARGGGHQRRRLRSCCATPTAARCPTRCSASSARSRAYFGADQQLGIHTQNDTGCAVANSVAAVLGGATQLQGTINGYGERTGNANLMTCIPNLELKLGRAVPARGPPRAAHRGEPPRGRAGEPAARTPPTPTSGQSAFAHKGGLHTSALGKAGGATYEHIDPDAGRQRHPRAGVRPRRAGRHGDEGQGARRRPRRPGRRPAVADELKELEAEGFVLRGGRRLASSC